MTTYMPIEVAMALSLYGYNVSPETRAKKIFDHFEGCCAEMTELVQYMQDYGSAATAMAYPTAKLYVQHALERYGAEARRRCYIKTGVPS